MAKQKNLSKGAKMTIIKILCKKKKKDYLFTN